MNIILKGNICYSKTPQELSVTQGGYLVCADGLSKGVFDHVPEKYSAFPIKDYGEFLVIPGLIDLHTHAPQYAFRGLGMDMELLDWLRTYTYPEEIKYADVHYANKAYDIFVSALSRSATTRACIFATVHVPATTLLMEKLEKSGISSYVGLVNMDRNCPETLRQNSPAEAFEITNKWIEDTSDRFENTKPILTPRFIPACSEELLDKLSCLQQKFNLPVQSHLSENTKEVELVKSLNKNPDLTSYAAIYDHYKLFGGFDAPAIMAHCVWCDDKDRQLLRDNGVYVAHCPQSNSNLASGIAPIREYLTQGIKTGLGSDVAGGCHLSIFRAMTDAVQVSKLYHRHVDEKCTPLTLNEAFYLGTLGGGSFFGKVGSFGEDFELDAVIIDDSPLPSPNPLSLEERLSRVIYFADEIKIVDKYIKGIRTM
ncbi:MAG: amidohydrolase family protein [Oscillospiraceae bacterium]|nr:amidohydrolase family protein [Oscillospiraceae bacterium]